MICVYSSNVIDFRNNGLSILDMPIRAQVKERLNGLYELELEYPYDNKNKYLNLIQNNILRVPTPLGDQPFRIYRTVRNMFSMTVYARHIFYDLLDNFLEDVRPTSLTGAGALDWILSHTQYSHNFTNMSDISTVASANYQMKNPVECLMGSDSNSFLNLWGGEIVRDNFSIKILTERGLDRGVLISYGKNLVGIEEELIMDEVFTRVFPTGLDSNNENLKLPEKYIDSPNINAYPYPKITEEHYQDIVVSDTMTTEQAYAALRAKVADLYAIDKIDIPKVNYKVSFMDLSQTVEYKNYSVLQAVYLGDTVTIKHSKLNINIKAKVLSYTYNCILNSYDEIELGNFIKMDTSTFFNSVSSNISDMKKTTETQKSDLLKAIDSATSMITGNKGGYVVLRPKNNPQEILIMDTPDVATAVNVWRWNLGGLGHSSTGVNGPYSTAITADGKIVADFITTGALNAARIATGILSAITIQNRDGSFKVDLGSYGGACCYNNDLKSLELSNNKIIFYNWGKAGDEVGFMGNINNRDSSFPEGNPSKPYVSLAHYTDSAASINYQESGFHYRNYISFDKYNVLQDGRAKPIKIEEGVEFVAECYFWNPINMRNYPIYLSSDGQANISSIIVDSTYYAARVPNLWSDSNVWANGIKLTNADYAEMFEWLDENINNEDRIGYLVELSGNKIVKANGDSILGAISATACVVGDNANEWNGKYLRDKWGRYSLDNEGNRQLNPNYDESLAYITRSERKEWGVVGLVGKIVVRDDGASSVGDYITAINGIATKSTVKTNIRVLERIDESTIKVFIR